MKKFLIVGNWKMNLTPKQSSQLVRHLNEKVKSHPDVEVVVAPSLISLESVGKEINRQKFSLCAQNAFYKDEGAYTGEVSFTQLSGLADYALVGHSERRIYFHETLEVVRDKVQAAVRNNITPILCVGETNHERINGETKRVVHDQVTTALSNLTEEEISKVVIAYEPVWAISTFGGGKPAKPDEIRSAIKWIRHVLRDLYGPKLAEDVRVIYGASVDAEFVGSILSLEGVEGLLPGAASINYAKFVDIVEAAQALASKKED